MTNSMTASVSNCRTTRRREAPSAVRMATSRRRVAPRAVSMPATFTQAIARKIGFQENRGNELIVRDGKLTGEVREPIIGREVKLATLVELREGFDFDNIDTLVVGDGANDLGMIGEAGLGVADENARLSVVGQAGSGSSVTLSAPPNGVASYRVFVQKPRAAVTESVGDITFALADEGGQEVGRFDSVFHGPGR